jgi:hypothetical protein
MARGWESKSIESQIEDSKARVETRDLSTPEERMEQQKRRRLEATRQRLVESSEATSSDSYRESLKHAIRHVEEELESLDD